MSDKQGLLAKLVLTVECFLLTPFPVCNDLNFFFFRKVPDAASSALVRLINTVEHNIVKGEEPCTRNRLEEPRTTTEP